MTCTRKPTDPPCGFPDSHGWSCCGGNDQPWGDECRRLRAEGLTQPEIVARLRLTHKAVRLALNETEEQKIALRRAKHRLRQRTKPRTRSPKKVNRFQTYWTARAAAPGVITPAIKQAAILAFSNHEIDRAELMKRVTPRHLWSREGLLRVE